MKQKSLPKRHFQIRQTESKGEGLFTRYPIFKGAYIGEYLGPRYPREIFKVFTEKTDSFYCYSTSDGYFVDGSSSANIMRKMNHSCQPNVSVEEWMDSKGVTHILFYASKTIPTDEELTIDYRVQTSKVGMKSLAKYRCYCESMYCRGTMLDLTGLKA